MCYKELLIPSTLAVVLAVLASLPAFEDYRDATLKFGKNLFLKGTIPVETVMTLDQLNLYDGSTNSKGLYLAILGNIYDVSTGKSHYGPGGGYHFFSAKDASRAYLSGNFKDDLIDKIDDFSDADMIQLDEWENFYNEKYKYVGKLVGAFYDKNGQPTKMRQLYAEKLDRGLGLKSAEDDDKTLFPPCNVAWKQNEGSTVWCSNESGGIKRDWVGVPREYFKPGAKTPRCACIRTSGKPGGNPRAITNGGDLENRNFKGYGDCGALAVSCKLNNL